MMRELLWTLVTATERWAEVALIKWARRYLLKWLTRSINKGLGHAPQDFEPPKVEAAGNMNDLLAKVSDHNLDPNSIENDASPKIEIHNTDDVSTPVDNKKP